MWIGGTTAFVTGSIQPIACAASEEAAKVLFVIAVPPAYVLLTCARAFIAHRRTSVADALLSAHRSGPDRQVSDVRLCVANRPIVSVWNRSPCNGCRNLRPPPPAAIASPVLVKPSSARR